MGRPRGAKPSPLAFSVSASNTALSGGSDSISKGKGSRPRFGGRFWRPKAVALVTGNYCSSVSLLCVCVCVRARARACVCSRARVRVPGTMRRRHAPGLGMPLGAGAHGPGATAALTGPPTLYQLKIKFNSLTNPNLVYVPRIPQTTEDRAFFSKTFHWWFVCCVPP
jgi:hypothetical protein